jgi:hypothetical protein
MILGMRLLFLSPMTPNIRLLFVAPLVALAFAACDQKPKTGAKPATEKKKAGPSIDARYEAARKLLLDGQFTAAAAAFHELGTEPKIRQPLFNWITTLEGMALLLDGREPEARKVYAALAARGPFSEKEQDLQMAKFFVDIGQALSGDAPIPAVAAKDYDRWTFEGIVFLLYALKDWNLENFEEAVPLFRQFANVQPEKMVAWADGPADLQRFQDIAQSCVDDYLEGRPALQGLVTATAIDQQREALEKAKVARAKMKLTTKLSKELDAKIAELSPKVAAVMAEKEKMSADEEAFDAKMLPEAKQKRLALHAKFLFAEARQAMLDPNLKTEKAKEEQQLLAKKSQWLANYMEQLIEDLNAKGYTQPLTSRKGQPIAGGVAKADIQQVLVNSPRGLVPVPWPEIAPDGIFAMGQSFIHSDLPPQILAFRKWHLGVFASFAGKPESLALLKEAAELRSLFAEELPVFEKPSDPW